MRWAISTRSTAAAVWDKAGSPEKVLPSAWRTTEDATSEAGTVGATDRATPGCDALVGVIGAGPTGGAAEVHVGRPGGRRSGSMPLNGGSAACFSMVYATRRLS